MLTMLLGGLWHGASWNFVLWGLYHGVLLVLYRQIEGKSWFNKDFLTFPKWIIMFSFTMIGWLFFRATNTNQISYFLTNFSFCFPNKEITPMFWQLMILSIPLILVQIMQNWTKKLLIILELPVFLLIIFYFVIILLLAFYGVKESNEFIYFQF